MFFEIIFIDADIDAGSSNGRTAPFEGVYHGSSPCPAEKIVVLMGSATIITFY